MKQLGSEALSWHHYALSWNRTSGVVDYFTDGRLNASIAYPSTRHSRFLEHRPVLTLGTKCYDTPWARFAFPTCSITKEGFTEFAGELDDFALYGRPLSEAEVAERWAAPLADRRAAGQEPDLVLLYDMESVDLAVGMFEDPSAPTRRLRQLQPVVPNLGSAGSDYDLLLGHFPRNPAYYGQACTPDDDPSAPPVALIGPHRVAFAASGAAGARVYSAGERVECGIAP